MKNLITNTIDLQYIKKLRKKHMYDCSYTCFLVGGGRVGGGRKWVLVARYGCWWAELGGGGTIWGGGLVW